MSQHCSPVDMRQLQSRKKVPALVSRDFPFACFTVPHQGGRLVGLYLHPGFACRSLALE